MWISINSMAVNDDYDNTADIADFLKYVVFFNLYGPRVYQPHCLPYENEPEMTQCPKTGYLEIAHLVRGWCDEIFMKCMWMGTEFDCCKYFLKVNTTLGFCYIMNSLHATQR